MINNIITVFERLRKNRKPKPVTNGPSWTHRRRLIYGAYILAVLMIVFGALSLFADSQIGVELVVGGVALLSIIVTAYTTSATYEDVRIWKRSGPTELEDPSDQFDTDNPDGV